MARFSTTLLSDPAEFVTTLCNVVPITLPASHVNALRIMNSLLSTAFLAGGRGGGSSSPHRSTPHPPTPASPTATHANPAYLSSDKHSFRERIAWMEADRVHRAAHGHGDGAAQIFEQLKRHLLLVRWGEASHMKEILMIMKCFRIFMMTFPPSFLSFFVCMYVCTDRRRYSAPLTWE